jgi:DNA-binding transcriptional LysR family regulator
VEPINDIERGVIEGHYQLGVIPIHRPSTSLDYHPLFEEQMYLYCAEGHPLFTATGKRLTPAAIRKSKYVGIGYHSPNMEVGRKLGQKRDATAYDQEAVAHLVLSGRYLGYLPEHYAESFVAKGAMRALRSDIFQYVCQFSAIVRHSPPPNRVVQTLLDSLILAHKQRPELVE